VVLVGDIYSLLQRAIKFGFNVNVTVLSSVQETNLLQTFEEITEAAEKIQGFNEEQEEVEEYNIDNEHELQNFLTIYGIEKIHTLEILGMKFNSLIHVAEEEADYVINNQIFNQTFLKVWNVETRYRNNLFIRDIIEFSALSLFSPILVVLPSSVLGMIKNFLTIENQQNLYCFDTIDHLLTNLEKLQNLNFKGILCLQEHKQTLQSFSFCAEAAIYWVDDALPSNILDRLLKSNLDLSNSDRLGMLSAKIKTILTDLPSTYSAKVQKYIPPELSTFLFSGFGVVESSISTILQGKPNKNLKEKIQETDTKHKNLNSSFEKSLALLEKESATFKEPIVRVIEELKGLFSRSKILRDEIQKLVILNENNERIYSEQAFLIEKEEKKLRHLAQQQYQLAEVVGKFITFVLRQNISLFGKTQKLTLDARFLSHQRKIFNFTSEEWSYFYGQKIYFCTNHQNVNRLLSTLLKAESIPENSFLEIITPESTVLNQHAEKIDWIFYDQSSPMENVNRVSAIGKSRFTHDQFNETVTKTEAEKTRVLQTLFKLKEAFTNHESEKIRIEENLETLDKELELVTKASFHLSKKYQSQLQKFRSVTESMQAFQHFMAEIEANAKRMNEAVQNMLKLEQENLNPDGGSDPIRMAKYLSVLGEEFGSFYKSLVSIKFIAQTLESFAKIMKNFRYKIAIKSLENSKLKPKIVQSSVRNVLVLQDASNYSMALVENLMPMMMMHLRLPRENFKIQSNTNFEAFLNRGYNYYLIVTNNQQDFSLSGLRKMVETICNAIENPIILAFAQYPSYFNQTGLLLKNETLHKNLGYIRSKAVLLDSNRIMPDNKLQISSVYLYSLYSISGKITLAF